MGHQHLLRLPASQQFRQIVALIAGGADVQDIAAATSIAAETQMIDASNDPAVRHSFWLLTQIPLAARQDDFPEALKMIGLNVDDPTSLVSIVAAMVASIDAHVDARGGRTDLGEMAELSAAESLSAIAGRELPDLFVSGPNRVKPALAGLASDKHFAVLARDFFSRLARRMLSYFLSREVPQHVGRSARFHTVREHMAFEKNLDLHCRESSRILKEFAGTWFSKHTYEGGITKSKAGRFVHIAFKKLREELARRRSPGV